MIRQIIFGISQFPQGLLISGMHLMNDHFLFLCRPQRFIQLVGINCDQHIKIMGFNVVFEFTRCSEDTHMLITFKSACPAVILQKSKMHFRTAAQKLMPVRQLCSDSAQQAKFVEI
ncbi:hypothetical protein D3C81_1924870 [compost metagenome]